MKNIKKIFQYMGLAFTFAGLMLLNRPNAKFIIGFGILIIAISFMIYGKK